MENLEIIIIIKKAGHGREECVVFLFCFMVNLLI